MFVFTNVISMASAKLSFPHSTCRILHLVLRRNFFEILIFFQPPILTFLFCIFSLICNVILSINLEFAYFFNISIYITCDTFHILRILFRTLNTNTVGFYLIMQINRLFMTKRNFLPVQNIYLLTKSLPFCYSSVILQVIIIT